MITQLQQWWTTRSLDRFNVLVDVTLFEGKYYVYTYYPTCMNMGTPSMQFDSATDANQFAQKEVERLQGKVKEYVDYSPNREQTYLKAVLDVSVNYYYDDRTIALSFLKQKHSWYWCSITCYDKTTQEKALEFLEELKPDLLDLNLEFGNINNIGDTTLYVDIQKSLSYITPKKDREYIEKLFLKKAEKFGFHIRNK